MKKSSKNILEEDQTVKGFMYVLLIYAGFFFLGKKLLLGAISLTFVLSVFLALKLTKKFNLKPFKIFTHALWLSTFTLILTTGGLQSPLLMWLPFSFGVVITYQPLNPPSTAKTYRLIFFILIVFFFISFFLPDGITKIEQEYQENLTLFTLILSGFCCVSYFLNYKKSLIHKYKYAQKILAIIDKHTLVNCTQKNDTNLDEKHIDCLSTKTNIKKDNSKKSPMEKQLQFTLSHAQRAIAAQDIFMMNISHELRTPVQAIMGLSEHLSETSLDIVQQNYVSLIAQSVTGLKAVIDDIIDFSNLKSGQLQILKKPFTLEHVTNELKQNFYPLAHKKEQTIEIESDPALPPKIFGDGHRLKQILTLLLHNSIKFTPPNGVIKAAFKKEMKNNQLMLHVRVEDNGIGIPPEKLEEIFYAFKQVQYSTSREFGGTGLGLPIVKELVEQMGGIIQVLSEEKKGTLFHFSIPIEAVEEKQSVDLGPLESLAQRFPIKILLAEDDKTNQLVIKTHLKRLGYQADLANDGLEALEMASTNTYDMILMDLMMPKIDGLDTAKKILSRTHVDKHPVIVALTANARIEDEKKCLDAGMKMYLKKPASREKIVEAIVFCYQEQQAAFPTKIIEKAS